MATLVGVEVLREGGNAVDAAVAVAFALAVTFPEAGNIGGGGFLVMHDSARDMEGALDFREKAPLAAYPELYTILADSGNPDASREGVLSSGIPGSPAGLYTAWEEWGSLPWERIVNPSVELALDGFPVGEGLLKRLSDASKYAAKYRSFREGFYPNGVLPKVGDILIQEDLGGVLSIVAKDGVEPFYRGALAEKLVSEVRKAGGIWTLEDLENYRAEIRDPVRIAFPDRSGVELIAMPPPSSGALVIGQTLAYLEFQGALDRRAENARRAAALVESLRLAFADRNTKLGDPGSMPVPLTELLSHAYLIERSAMLPSSYPGDSRSVPSDLPGRESDNTTHICVIDRNGMTVSLTTTLNSLFGSKWIVPGTGILLNNQMDDFNAVPGKPNLYKLVGYEVNDVKPGARMLSSMAPTIVLKEGEVWFALGARGGPRILTSVLQVIINRCIDGMNLVDAVAAPRIHHQWYPDAVYFEKEVEAHELRKSLDSLGYHVEFRPMVGKVLAVERLPGGELIGVVDPRTCGLAMPVVAR